MFLCEIHGVQCGQRAKRPWKSNLQQHLLLSADVEELGGKVFNMAAGRNICRKKGWMRLRSKEKIERGADKKLHLLPNCRNSFRCLGCVIFLPTGLLSVHVFIWRSKAKETREDAALFVTVFSCFPFILNFFCPSVWCWQGCRNCSAVRSISVHRQGLTLLLVVIRSKIKLCSHFLCNSSFYALVSLESCWHFVVDKQFPTVYLKF